MITSAQLDRMLDKRGRTVTLRRRGSPDIDVPCKAVVIGYKPDQLVNGVIQGDRQVTLSNTPIAAQSWPGPPKNKDFIVIDGREVAIQSCDTRYVGETPFMHVIQVRG